MLLLRILGWLWMALGIWWVLRPAGARRRFRRQFRRRLLAVLVVVFLACASLMFAAGRVIGGVWGWLLPTLSVVALIPILFLARTRVSEPVLDWWGRQPFWVYRAFGAATFLLGLALQWAGQVVGD